MSYIKYNKKIVFLLFPFIFIFPFFVHANDNLTERLAGRILLEVQSHGEAWYVNPGDKKRYSMGRPDDAFSIMRQLGIGITNDDLEKFPIGLDKKIFNGQDSDNDGLPDELEKILATDPQKIDSDGDGYSDYTETINNYNPLENGKLKIDKNFAKSNSGKIYLQVESAGEAWYINPNDNSRYYLGRPADAFRIMRAFGLGITTSDINNIEIFKKAETPVVNNPSPISTSTKAEEVISNVATAIRKKDGPSTASYFIPAMNNKILYVVQNMPSESLLLLGNILSGSTLKSQTDSELIYKNDVYFSLGGYSVPLEFHVKKQADGKWLMTDL